MKIKKITIVIFLLLVPILKPLSFGYIPILDNIYNILKIGIFLSLIFMYLVKGKIKNISKLTIIMCLYEACILMSTIINKRDITGCLSTAFNILLFLITFDYFFKDHPHEFIKALFTLLTLLIILNITSFTFDYSSLCNYDGPIYFLGIRTRFSDVIFPYIFLSLVYYKTINKNVFILILSLVISLINIFYVNISTAIGGVFIFFIALIFISKFKNLKILDKRNIIIYGLGINILIAVFRIQNIFSVIIENILGKRLDFTGRTFIWDKIINLIKSSPLIGVGYSAKGFVEVRGFIWHAHNQILQIMAEGGIISLIPFVYLLFTAFKNIQKENKIYPISLAMILSLLIMMTFEKYAGYPYFYIVLYITYFVKYLENDITKVGEAK